MLRVQHYFPLGSDNVGDRLVARAIRVAFVRHFGPARVVEMPVNDRFKGGNEAIGLTGDNIDRANAEADLVIVGGSNLLEPRKPRRDHSPGEPPRAWGVFTDVPSLERLQTPVLLVGMGTGSGFGRAIRPYSDSAEREIRMLHHRSIGAAVRDRTTQIRLAQIGAATVCTGCPVTFLSDRPVATGDPRLPLVVAFPPSRIVDKPRGRQFMRRSMRFVAWLGERGVKVVLTLHEARDVAAAREWAPPHAELFHTTDVDELIARYEASRGVIGFRLHAALLAIGLGIPAIPVAIDWRGKSFVDTFGLGRWSIRAGRAGQFSRLRRLGDRLLAGDGELCRDLDEAKSRFHERFEQFFARAAATYQRSRPIAACA